MINNKRNLDNRDYIKDNALKEFVLKQTNFANLVCGAVESGNEANVYALLSNYKKWIDINAPNSQGITPLGKLFDPYPGYRKGSQILHFLLDNGADVSKSVN